MFNGLDWRIDSKTLRDFTYTNIQESIYMTFHCKHSAERRLQVVSHPQWVHDLILPCKQIALLKETKLSKIKSFILFLIKQLPVSCYSIVDGDWNLTLMVPSELYYTIYYRLTPLNWTPKISSWDVIPLRNKKICGPRESSIEGGSFGGVSLYQVYRVFLFCFQF